VAEDARCSQRREYLYYTNAVTGARTLRVAWYSHWTFITSNMFQRRSDSQENLLCYAQLSCLHHKGHIPRNPCALGSFFCWH